ncbi:hypothetical protein U1Q18_050390 [Sarracenia purpurea var. burkii]
MKETKKNEETVAVAVAFATYSSIGRLRPHIKRSNYSAGIRLSSRRRRQQPEQRRGRAAAMTMMTVQIEVAVTKNSLNRYKRVAIPRSTGSEGGWGTVLIENRQRQCTGSENLLYWKSGEGEKKKSRGCRWRSGRVALPRRIQQHDREK